MSDRPLVSALMATYDRPDVMPRALRSVLEQSYDPLEVVVVDDHSPESQVDLVRSISAEYDSEVTVHRHEENRGWGAAMNTAFGHADGEFLATIGDDDRWSDPEKITKQVEAFRSTNRENVGIVAPGWREISETTGDVQNVVIPNRPENLERHILAENRIIQSIGTLIRREAWEAVGGTDEELPRGIDSDLFRRMIFAGYDVLFMDEPVIDIYVDRGDRMTAKRDPDDIWPHIEGERAKFEKFPEAFERYPSAESRVLEKIGTHYVNIYRSTGTKEHLSEARDHYRRSLFLDYTNWRTILRYVWSAAVQLAVLAGR